MTQQLYTFKARSHKSLLRPTRCNDVALPNFEKHVLWDIFERLPRNPFTLNHGIFTPKDQLVQRTTEHSGCAETQVALTGGQEVGCSMSQASGSAASGSQLWYDTQGWGWAAFHRILKVGKDSQDGAQPCWAAVSPQSCLLHEGMDINGDSHLDRVRVLQTWQLFRLLEWCVLAYSEVFPWTAERKGNEACLCTGQGRPRTINVCAGGWIAVPTDAHK